MGQVLGFVTAGLQLGLQSVLVRPYRAVGEFEAQVTLEEVHTDELEITDHPVETGARISDHAFMRPAEIVIRCGWSNSPSVGDGGLLGLADSLVSGLGATVSGVVNIANSAAAQFGLPGLSSELSGNSAEGVKDIYSRFLELQRSRVPVQVFTGKRIYDDMLVKSLRTETTKETENSLILTVQLRQILIVRTQVVTIAAPKSAQADPSKTAPVETKGTKTLDPGINYNAGAGRGSVNPALVVP